MKKFSRYYLLYLFNWLIFIFLYSIRFFNFLVFRSVSESITMMPLPGLIRSILIVLWMIIPQTLILYAVNKSYLKIKPKQFIYNQLLFALSIVLFLEILLASAK